MDVSSWGGKNRKIWEVVGAIIVVLVAIYVVTVLMNRQGWVQQKPVNKLQDVKPAELPKGMPSDLPIETGAKILNNFNATAPNGQVQATRTYLSAKAVQTNYDIYKSYLTAHKWSIVTEVKDPKHPEILSIFARNAKGTISITIQKNNVNPTGSTVTVTFVSAK